MQSNKPLKYIGYSIVFQEVPNEISLAINVSDCPYKCRGCHSKYLWEYKGNYIKEEIDSIILENDFMITCVCFMGGDQNLEELKSLLMYIKKEYQLKTCLYTGCDNIESLNSLLPYLDYLKIGKYDENYGALDSKNTNQKMYTVIDGDIKEDITKRFQKL